jgi:hypothetical protein
VLTWEELRGMHLDIYSSTVIIFIAKKGSVKYGLNGAGLG